MYVCVWGEDSCSRPPQAFGHENCNSGSKNYVFGQGNAHWTLAYCKQDSDGDGKTNGDELGDPCCTWHPGGGAPQRATDISHPGERASKTAAASCATAAPAPTAFAAAAGDGAGAVLLTWAALPPTACACRLELVVTAAGSARRAMLLAPAATAFMLCGVSNSTSSQIAVHVVNWAGTSPDASVTVAAPLVPHTGIAHCSVPFDGKAGGGPRVVVLSKPTAVCRGSALV